MAVDPRQVAFVARRPAASVTRSGAVPDPRSIDRIIVIKLSALGDVANAIPTVRAVRAQCPQAHLTWVVKPGFADLLRGNPDIDRLLLASRSFAGVVRAGLALRRMRADALLDMHGLFASGCMAALSGAAWRCTWQSGRELSGLLTGNPIVPGPPGRTATENLFGFARVLGAVSLDTDPPAYLTRSREAIDRAATLLPDSRTPWIGFHLGASEPNKRWPAAHWSGLGDRLADAGLNVVLFGAPGDAAVGEQVTSAMHRRPLSLIGKTSLRDLAACLARCVHFVGCDTGATHIAALVGVPTVALMGATDPQRTRPHGERHAVAHLGLPCSPCFRRPTCGGRFTCMSDLRPGEIAELCLSRIGQQRNPSG